MSIIVDCYCFHLSVLLGLALWLTLGLGVAVSLASLWCHTWGHEVIVNVVTGHRQDQENQSDAHQGGSQRRHVDEAERTIGFFLQRDVSGPTHLVTLVSLSSTTFYYRTFTILGHRHRVWTIFDIPFKYALFSTARAI